LVGWETIFGKMSTTYIKIPQCMQYFKKDIDNGYELLLFKRMIEHEKRKHENGLN
jgi:hypothetical protein